MKIHNLYTDDKGESHFRDIEVEWAEERRGSKLSKRLPANGIIFRETKPENEVDWHNAPRRQYIITLAGHAELVLSGGQTLQVGPGSIELADDLAEAYQGRHGLIGPITLHSAKKTNNVVEFLEDSLDKVEKLRYKVCDKEDTAIQNIIDGIVDLYLSTLYKLKFLA